mgnify:CR=1 FL=1
MARFYPAYLKVGVEEVTLSDTMLRILKLQADGMSKEKNCGRAEYDNR